MKVSYMPIIRQYRGWVLGGAIPFLLKTRESNSKWIKNIILLTIAITNPVNGIKITSEVTKKLITTISVAKDVAENYQIMKLLSRM